MSNHIKQQVLNAAPHHYDNNFMKTNELFHPKNEHKVNAILYTTHIINEAQKQPKSMAVDENTITKTPLYALHNALVKTGSGINLPDLKTIYDRAYKKETKITPLNNGMFLISKADKTDL